MTPYSERGLVDLPTDRSVDETVERIKRLLEEKGITLFALIDHTGEAAKVGMKMRPTKLLIFGTPKAGTPLMLASPRSGTDLPLKILVWEEETGKTWVTYNSSAYLKERHGLPENLLPNIAAIETIAKQAVQ
jgi:uncharacterized protein (DUF302 family)